MNTTVTTPRVPPLLVPMIESGYTNVSFGEVTANVPKDIAIEFDAFIGADERPVLCALCDVAPNELYAIIAFVTDGSTGEVTFRATFSATGNFDDVNVNVYGFPPQSPP